MLRGPLQFLRSPTLRVIAVALFAVVVLFLFRDIPSALRWPVRIAWLAAVIWLGWMAVKTLRSAQWTLRKVSFVLILGLFYYAALSFACRVFVAVMSTKDDRLTSRYFTRLPEPCKEGIHALINAPSLTTFDKEIGWIPTPGHRGSDYIVNRQGARSTKEYPLPAPDLSKRILCLGDSFTFGIAVKNEESYPAQAETKLPGTEWINLGIPGGCLTQAFVRYPAAAAKFGGNHVVVGFMTNDAQRTVNCFRPFVNADSGCPFAKPYAKFEDGKLTIEPNPYSSLDDFKRLLANETSELEKLRKMDYLTWSKSPISGNSLGHTARYLWEANELNENLTAILNQWNGPGKVIDKLLPDDPYGSKIWNPQSPGFQAIAALFERFHQQIVADGRQPLFVIIPGPLDVRNSSKGYPCQYDHLRQFLIQHHIAFIDFLPVLVAKHKKDLSQDALFVRQHYKPVINGELADEIIKALHLNPAGE